MLKRVLVAMIIALFPAIVVGTIVGGLMGDGPQVLDPRGAGEWRFKTGSSGSPEFWTGFFGGFVATELLGTIVFTKMQSPSHSGRA